MAAVDAEKPILWRTLIAKLRSEGDIVLPVASSGIAATLLPGGRTAHSRFKIPIVLDDYSLCNIGQNSDIAELIRQTKLIIWDEAPMQHRYAFECLDRSLKNIMKSVDPIRSTMPFGGITVVLGGDFRQILPVITQGDRGEIVSACITRSRLWSICKIFLLTTNMRLNQGKTAKEVEELLQFAKWVLDAGDGKLPLPDKSILPDAKENDILIPPQFCDTAQENTVDNMIESTFPDFVANCTDPKYLSERAILTPTNQTVSHLNSLIVEKLPGESVSYYSVDSAEEFGGTDEDLNSAFPIEYLNSINLPGMPPHEIKLKVGVVVMLMRNLNQTLGLCNGTRMIITKCLKFCVECEICYVMTINKAQGQSLQNIGLYLPKAVFTHGQFYVAISRVTSPQGLRIFVDDEAGQPSNITQNVVYKEVFYALPRS
ncbi:ATP-dependent DNA helicase pfh1-like [Daucus carota subsp. sativus]|uniref:ATP-dependent DNA helicase pfh1-like n=1 Tax=Daucus carota subsp. sativus TaxID=79200 RepID=UPI0007EFD34A|nr:PREDICTED: ATP-dependent DNA helicase pfh1-like [Daucus carota subsp. sativus]